MPIDPKQVQELFLEVVKLAVNKRAMALEAACGDNPELLRRVEALLRAHDAPDSLFTPAPSSSTPEPTLDSSQLPVTKDSDGASASVPQLTQTAEFRRGIEAGAVIAGRYQLQQKLGEGGMGEVWAAKQTEPVRRKVALKLIKAGMDSAAVLARFDQERQALAIMDHPNIARVLDGGMTETGQPYFVMELVNGLPLTKFCDEAKLDTNERLQLFTPICQAVQHAHQKGVVHRDLKPANILVTMIDGVPVPKVIDFGVAKATGGKLTNDSLSTQFGAVIGTLEYMAPEQTGYSGSDIDTRADIYSLGVVLYELLTGLRPIDSQRLKRAGLAEMLRVIQEEEPSKPSTRLSSDAALPSLAATRRVDPRKLTSMLRGELDWVVMKCLEKSRDRRYETANALARDIQRYLANEAVEARPPSASYRMQKFLSRNRRFVLATSLIALALVGGIVGTTWGWFEAQRQAGIARRETQVAEDAQRREAEQRANAEQANRQAFNALNAFTSDLMGTLLGSKENLSSNDIAILENAQKQWEVFANSKGDSVEMRSIRASGAKNLGIIQFKLGLLEQAEASERRALAICESLSDEFPDNLDYRKQLAAAAQQLGGLLRGSGRTRDADQHFRNAERIRESLLLNDPDNADLAMDWSETCVSVANVARDIGEWDKATTYYRKALDVQERCIEKNPSNLSYYEALAGCTWGLAFLYKRLDDFDAANEYYLKTIDTCEHLANRRPDSISYRERMGNLHREYGVALYDHGNDEAGAAQIKLGMPTLQALAAEFPSVPRHQFNLARSHRDLGKVLGYLEQYDNAEEHFAESIRLFGNLTESQPTNELYQRELGLAYTMLGNLRFEGGKPEESLASYNLAILTLTRVFVQNRELVLAKTALRKAHEYRADSLDKLGRHAEALADRDKVLEYIEPERRAFARLQRADTCLRSGDTVTAMAEIAELVEAENEDPRHWTHLAGLYSIASEALPDQRHELIERAGRLLHKAVEHGFDDVELLRSDIDLEAIRGTEAYQAIEQQLSAKSP